MDKGTIRVTGQGRISLPPDLVRLEMDLKSRAGDYEAAVALGAKELEDLRQHLSHESIGKEDIKTNYFDISPRYKREKNLDGDYENIFIGYEVQNSLYLEIEMDSKRLGKILSRIGQSLASPEVKLVFKTSKKEEMEGALIESAVADGRYKAETLAKASGAELGQILSIDYSYSEISLNSIVYSENSLMRAEASYDTIDLVADDISSSNSVTIVWELN